ncbi:MAG: Gfo/Idh/MocA family oxidoreductase [Phycisphaerales bacterium]
MLSRRAAIQVAAATAGSLALNPLLSAAPAPRRKSFGGKLSKLQLLQVGVGGTIAPADRDQLEHHPDVVFVGLCDVDSDALSAAAKDRPQAFTCRDFREAFDKHADKFDAVVVCVPDHNHALVDLTALKAGKHVYGQKPLVQQLSEVAAIENAIKARPSLVTQVGNQRMGPPGRQHAVDILRRGLLGKAIEAHVWVGGPPDQGDGYFYYGGLKEPTPPPANLDWNLWLGAAADAPYREGLAPVRWRSSWDYGTGQLGDWCTHLLDVLYFAYDLPSPIAVLSQTRTPSDFYHAQHVASTLTYPGGGERFARPQFAVHYCDKSQAPSRASIGVPEGKFGGLGTLVVCEGGVLYVQPEGEIEVWQGGKPVDWKTIPGQGQIVGRNHWHSWVDKILGKPDAFVQTPFAAGAAMAEAGLLCSKAARYPGQELRWDKATLTFTNNEEATKSIVRREYRKGFELPSVAATT